MPGPGHAEWPQGWHRADPSDTFLCEPRAGSPIALPYPPGSSQREFISSQSCRR